MTDETVSFHDEPTNAGPVTCFRCQARLSEYWSVSTGVSSGVCCERCKDELLAERTSSVGATRRASKALLFGLGGMLAGAIVWYAVARYADFQAGIIAILLGWLVGKGIHYGSEKRGGLGYQLMAVVIAYLGIGLASVPFVIEGMSQNAAEVAEVPPADTSASAQLAGLDSAIAAGKELDQEATSPVAALAMGSLALVLLALTIPVRVVLHGGSLITGLIYAIALYEAWKFSRGVHYGASGPHQVGAPR